VPRKNHSDKTGEEKKKKRFEWEGSYVNVSLDKSSWALNASTENMQVGGDKLWEGGKGRLVNNGCEKNEANDTPHYAERRGRKRNGERLTQKK